MPYCGFCGNDVHTPFCPQCGSPTIVELSIQRERAEDTVKGVACAVNQRLSDTEAAPQPAGPGVVQEFVDGFHRTPLQIALLALATFGVYSIYYVVRGRRLAQHRLAETIDSYWLALFLILPFVNFMYLCQSINKLQRRTALCGVVPPMPFWFQLILMDILEALWRLPDPYFFVLCFAPLLLGTIHVSVAHAERIDYPYLVWPRLHWFEWIILIGGLGVLSLGVVGYAMESSAFAYDAVGFAAAIVIALVFFFFTSRQLGPLTIEPT
jgi:hypothetical protein